MPRAIICLTEETRQAFNLAQQEPPLLKPQTAPPRQKKRGDPEHQHQCALINWWRLQAPQWARRLLFAIPNGGDRDKRVAVRLKLEGVQPGVPDLFLPIPAQGLSGLWIEMKAKGGQLSKAQKEMGALLQRMSYRCEVCFSWLAAKNAITNYLGEEFFK